jgi:hypothetical protein
MKRQLHGAVLLALGGILGVSGMLGCAGTEDDSVSGEAAVSGASQAKSRSISCEAGVVNIIDASARDERTARFEVSATYPTSLLIKNAKVTKSGANVIYSGEAGKIEIRPRGSSASVLVNGQQVLASCTFEELQAGSVQDMVLDCGEWGFSSTRSPGPSAEVHYPAKKLMKNVGYRKSGAEEIFTGEPDENGKPNVVKIVDTLVGGLDVHIDGELKMKQCTSNASSASASGGDAGSRRATSGGDAGSK